MTRHKMPEAALAIFRAMGRRGGKQAAANMSKAARIARARAAGKASVKAKRAKKRSR